MMKSILNKVFSVVTNPVFLAVLALFASLLYGTHMGIKVATQKYELQIANLKNDLLKVEKQQLQDHNTAIQEIIKQMVAQQDRADKAESELLITKQNLAKRTNELQKEVIKYVEKNTDRCPAFDTNGLWLYTKALGYITPSNQKPVSESPSSIKD